MQDLRGDQPRLLGYPVYMDDNLASPAANAVSAVFAAWVPFYTIRRVDGRVLIAAAGVAIKHSAT